MEVAEEREEKQETTMAERADETVSYCEYQLDLTQFGLNVAKTIVKIGTHVPVVGEVFGLCEDILNEIQVLKDMADDVAEVRLRAGRESTRAARIAPRPLSRPC